MYIHGAGELEPTGEEKIYNVVVIDYEPIIVHDKAQKYSKLHFTKKKTHVDRQFGIICRSSGNESGAASPGGMDAPLPEYNRLKQMTRKCFMKNGFIFPQI